jgi:hypothetical protein
MKAKTPVIQNLIVNKTPIAKIVRRDDDLFVRLIIVDKDGEQSGYMFMRASELKGKL